MFINYKNPIAEMWVRKIYLRNQLKAMHWKVMNFLILQGIQKKFYHKNIVSRGGLICNQFSSDFILQSFTAD